MGSLCETPSCLIYLRVLNFKRYEVVGREAIDKLNKPLFDVLLVALAPLENYALDLLEFRFASVEDGTIEFGRVPKRSSP